MTTNSADTGFQPLDPDTPLRTPLTPSESSVPLINPTSQSESNAVHGFYRRFQKLLERSRDYFILTDAQGNVLYTNTPVDPILGYTSEEYRHIPAIELLHPDEIAAAGEYFQSLLSSPGTTSTGEFRRRHKQGHYVWVEIQTHNLLDDPEVAALVVNHHDISERKKAEEVLLDTMQELQRSREQYSQLIESQMDFICRFRPDFTITFSNRAHADLFGKDPEEVVGKRLTDLIPRKVGEDLVSFLSSLTTEHPSATWEQHVIQAGGVERWVQWRDIAAFDDSGRAVEYQGVGRDITERKQAELAEREQRRIAEVLRDSLAALTTSLDADAVLRQLLDYAAKVVPCDAGSIILFEDGGGHVAYMRGYGSEAEEFFEDYRLSVGSEKFGKVHSGRESYLIPDTALYADWIPLPITSWIRSTIGVAITIRGEVIGLIAADSAVSNHFQQKDVDNLQTFARYASLALENAYHVSELEQKVAERTAELNLAKERVESILDNSLDGIILTDLNLQIQQTNTAFDRLVSGAAGDCLGKSLLELLAPEEVERVYTAFQMAAKERSGNHVETRIRHQNGAILEVELGIGYVDAGEALPNGLVCTIRDVGPRKERERQLRFHASLQDNIHDAVISTDLNNIIQSWNQAAERIYGWSASEAIGKSAYEILRPPPELAGARDQAIEELRESGSWLGEVIQLHRNDTRLHFYGSLSVLEDENGVRFGVVAVNHDITERVKAEQALAAKMREDQEFQKYLTALHEVTIELTAIDDLDSFYKRTVELGLEHFGLDRLALFLNENGLAVGTYGTDALGRLTDEHDLRVAPTSDGILIHVMQKGKRFHSIENTPLYEKERFIGTGWKAATALRNESETLGWFVSDNGIHFQAASKPQLDILALYSLTVGTLLAQKRTQVALHASEALYRILADNISDIVTRKDREGNYLYISPSIHTILGYEPEELLGQSAFDNYHPDEMAALRQSFASILTSHNIDEETYRYRHKDGHYVWLETTRHAIVSDNAEEVTGIITSSRDVTERKRAEAALQKYAAEVHDLYNNAPCGYHSLDADGIYVQINDTELRWLGYSREEVIGSLRFQDIITPESRQSFYDIFAVFKERGWISDLEFDYVRRDGTIKSVLLSATAIKDERGQYLSSRSTIFDVTDRKQAQRALQESEARYRLLADNISDVVVRIDTTGKILYASPSSHATLGYLPEELVNFDSSALVHPDDLGEVYGKYAAMAANGEVLHPVAYRFRHKQGYYAWMETTGQVLRSETTGEVIGLILSNRDVTERKIAEEALRSSEEMLRKMVEIMPVGVWLVDASGKLTLGNSAAKQIWAGLEYVGIENFGVYKAWWASSGELIEPHEWAAARAVTKGEISLDEELEIECFDGTHKYILNSAIPIHDDSQKIVGAIVINQDITERKRMENARRESEALFRSLIEAAPDYILRLDYQGNIQMTNPATLHDSGFQQQEMIGHPFTEFLTPESQAVFAQELHHLLEEGTSRFDLEFMNKAGMTAVMECSGSVTHGDDGQPPSIVLVHRDVTQRKQAEALLRQALEREKELNELKSRFVSMASHEFRTPLAAILASSEILLAYRKRMNEEQINGKLNTIEDQVKHLANIVEDVLDLSRMQTGRVEFKPIELELNSFVIEIIGEFQTRLDIFHNLVYEPNPVSILLKIDRRLMRQVLSNLLSNAIKYSPEGSSVTITLDYSDTSALLSVSDQGIGIPESDLKYLFEPFHRGSNVADISGTGLGLSIVKQAIEMHGGHIWVESKVGLGTTVYLSIPLPTPRGSTE